MDYEEEAGLEGMPAEGDPADDDTLPAPQPALRRAA
jgi:hypothetical protein